LIRRRSGTIEWLEFELFQGIPGLVHGVFLRHGGVSEGPYASLNVGGGSGDNPEKIAENRERIRQVLGVKVLLSSHQTHGACVHLFAEHLPFEKECDGMMTQEKSVGLMAKHADCQIALIYDPVRAAIAAVHAGWRGNVQNIYAKAVAGMNNAFGSKPKDLLVGISPSLGPGAAEFIHYREEFPESFWKFQEKPHHFNLWEIGREQFLQAGILPSHLEIASICTKSHPEDFFSYRREKMSGRHGTVIALS